MRSTSKPCLSSDLTPLEQRFLAAMHALRFGRFEYIQIRGGQIVLDPWPVAVRDVKFGSQDAGTPRVPAGDSELKAQVAELFAYVRSLDAGEVRTLEVKHGLPFSMEVEQHLMGGRRG
jgi:hypothetical protein